MGLYLDDACNVDKGHVSKLALLYREHLQLEFADVVGEDPETFVTADAAVSNSQPHNR